MLILIKSFKDNSFVLISDTLGEANPIHLKRYIDEN